MKRLALWCMALAAACGPKMIPDLDIDVPDTPDNRALLGILERFQQAYERKDVEAIAALASSRFFEDCGTANVEDDYDLDGLRRHFGEHFQKIEKPALTITLKDLRVEENNAVIDYRFLVRYLMKLPSGDRWQMSDEMQRMKLVREDGGWKVLSGL